MSGYKIGEQVAIADEVLYFGHNLQTCQGDYLRGQIGTIREPRDSHGDYWVEANEEFAGYVNGRFLSPVPDEAPTEPAPVREATLTTAANLISGDRAKDYGDAAESFTRLAALWTPILGVDVTPEQVALCLTQLKISRLIQSPGHTDSWVDAAGYIALGSEIAAKSRDADE